MLKHQLTFTPTRFGSNTKIPTLFIYGPTFTTFTWKDENKQKCRFNLIVIKYSLIGNDDIVVFLLGLLFYMCE